MFKIWIESHLWDTDDDILRKVSEFAGLLGGNNSLQITKVVETRRRNGVPRRMAGSMPTLPPPPSIPPRNPRKFKFLDIDPLELARQLTLMDSYLCLKIPPGECLSKAWPKQLGTDSTNITNMINTGNAVCLVHSFSISY